MVPLVVRRGSHLEGGAKSAWSHWRHGGARSASVGPDALVDADVDSHAVLEVLVACDECACFLVLEAEAIAIVQPEEVLDGGDDGVCRIMRVYVDSNGESGTLLGELGEQQLEGDLLLGQGRAGRVWAGRLARPVDHGRTLRRVADVAIDRLASIVHAAVVHWRVALAIIAALDARVSPSSLDRSVLTNELRNVHSSSLFCNDCGPMYSLPRNAFEEMY